jgi:hypothetical protein
VLPVAASRWSLLLLSPLLYSWPHAMPVTTSAPLVLVATSNVRPAP